MTDTVNASDYREWAALGLTPTESWEWEYANQADDYGDCLRGECWATRDDFRTTDGRRVIVYGTFGNYNSPGASHYTHAELYDGEAEYLAAVAEWEAKPEYV